MGETESTSVREDRICAILAVLFGAAFCWIWAGPNILNPTSVAWLARGDAAMHTLGWWFYRDAPWGWPPGANPGLGLELSSSVALADALPLFAIPFKLLSPLLPAQFQYWGLWFLLSFMLQGWFGYRLGRAVELTAPLALLGALFCIFYPPFLGRISGHMALGGHWSILAALYLYVRPVPPPRWAWPLLLATTAAIHGYLFVMCGGLWITSLAQRLWLRVMPWGSAVIEAVATVASIFAVLWLGGTLMVSSYSVPGFGVFHMNALSFVNSSGWSSLLPSIPLAHPGEGEGRAYPGTGMLVLFAVAVVLGMPLYLRRALTPRWLPLFVSCIGYTLFALSNVITVGPYTIGRIQLAPSLEVFLSILRASGRFFWPVGYLIIFLVLLVLQRRLRTMVLALAATMLLLQATDSAANWTRFRALGDNPSSEWPTKFTDPVWAALAPHYKRVRAMPVFELDPHWYDIGYFGYRYRLAVSAVYLARVDTRRLDAAIAASEETLATGTFEPDTIYVLSRGAALRALPHVRPDDLFIEVDDVILLARGGSAIATSTGHPQRYAPMLDPLPSNTGVVPNNGVVENTIIGSRPKVKYLLDGWSGPEDWGTWTERPSAVLAFRSDEAAGGTLRFHAQFIRTADGRPQEVDVLINGSPSARWSIETADLIDLELPLPAAVAEGKVQVEFRIAYPTRPFDIGLNTDMRKLGMALFSFELVPAAR